MVGLLRGRDRARRSRSSTPTRRRRRIGRRTYEALQRVDTPAFWDAFDADRYANLELLENRIAPLAMDNAFTFLRYVGTDVEAFFEAFPLAEVVEGEPIPTGQRGILVGNQFAEEWLKLKNARRLDQIKDARDRRGRRIANDEELQRWVKDNGNGVRGDPAPARPHQGRRGRGHGSAPSSAGRPTEPLEALLAEAPLRLHRRDLRPGLPRLLRARSPRSCGST